MYLMDGWKDRPNDTYTLGSHTDTRDEWLCGQTHTHRMNGHRLAGLMDRLMHKMNRLMHKMNRHMGHRYTDTQNGHSHGWTDVWARQADRRTERTFIGWLDKLMHQMERE